MSAAGLQQLSDDLKQDEALRQELRDNPDAVLSRYNLTEEERNAVKTALRGGWEPPVEIWDPGEGS